MTVFGVDCQNLNNKNANIYYDGLFHAGNAKITCSGGDAKVPINNISENANNIKYIFIRIYNNDGNEFESDKFEVIRTKRPTNNNSANNAVKTGKSNPGATPTPVITPAAVPTPSSPITPSAQVTNPAPAVENQGKMLPHSEPIQTPISNNDDPTTGTDNENSIGNIANTNGTNGTNGNAFNGKIGNGNVDNVDNVDNASTNEDSNSNDKKPSKGNKVMNTITFIIIISIIGGVIIFVAKVYNNKRKRNTINFGTGMDDMKPINEVPFPTFIPSKIIDTDKYIQID